jgi:hypothetical protein
MAALLRSRRALLPLWTAVALGCGGTSLPAEDAGPAGDGATTPAPDAGPPVAPLALFTLPREGTEPSLNDLPWPTEIRRTADGTLDLSGFPNPGNNNLVNLYREAVEEAGGWGLNGAIYFRFTAPIATDDLPADGAASLEEGAVAFLMDVDEDGAPGTRHPIRTYFQDTRTRFWLSHTLALRPVYGRPLASRRRYAAVVTRGLRAADGRAIARAEDLDRLLDGTGDATVEAARQTYASALEVLAENGVAGEDILSLAVFETMDATSQLIGLRDWLTDEGNYPVPTTGAVSRLVVGPGFETVGGTYGPSPIFQEGEIPYLDGGGGIPAVAPGADPVVQDTFDPAFELSVPTSPMPDGGYPVVLYAHGTGGGRSSCRSSGVAEQLAAEGIACFGIDQIHHGPRLNGVEIDPAIAFFNFLNPDAGRDNVRQSVLDLVQQRRAVATLETGLTRGEVAARLDPERILFMGHSQGGLNGPIFLAIDDGVRGGVLSAASGIITITLREKVEPPPPIPEVVRLALSLSGATFEEAFENEAFVVEHPVATLLQTFIDPSDATSYGHLVFQSPREGFAPKSVLMTEGLDDRFSPPRSIEALAGAIGTPLIGFVAQPVESLELQGLGDGARPPATANVAGGLATAGLIQYPTDGHFAVFRNPDGQAAYRAFLASLVDGVGTIR